MIRFGLPDPARKRSQEKGSEYIFRSWQTSVEEAPEMYSNPFVFVFGHRFYTGAAGGKQELDETLVVGGQL